MRQEILDKICDAVLATEGIHPHMQDTGTVSDPGITWRPDEWLKLISARLETYGIVVLHDEVRSEEAPSVIASAGHALLLLPPPDASGLPMLWDPKKKKMLRFDETDASEYTELDEALTLFGDKVLIAAFLRLDLFQEEAVPPAEKFRIVKTFGRLLATEKKNITAILLFAVVAGMISLTLPLGVQSLIGFVSSGQWMTSAVVLILLIVSGVLIAGLVQVKQMRLVEEIQQRFFSRTAFRFAWRIPRTRLESMLQYYPPELVNRFFDVVTLQKGTSVLLTEFSAAVLQIVFGLLLLSLYHPLFIFLGILVAATLLIMLRVTGPKGLKTSISESKYKYKVANWLEELARGMITFRLAGTANMPLDRTDEYVGGYLHYRNQHFKVLLSQYTGFVIFKTLMTALLLGVGCWLVLEQKINIGQFVATEIVIILVMNAVEKIVQKLDTVYDVLTAIDKLTTITELPLERNGPVVLPKKKDGLAVAVRSLRYKFPDAREPVLDGVNLDIRSGARVGIAGKNGCGKSTLVHVLLGLVHEYSGAVTYDLIPLRDLQLATLRDQVGNYVAQESLIEGTLLQNIVLGRRDIGISQVMEAIHDAGLSEFVASLPDGLQTQLVAGDRRIPGSAARKILLARSFVSNPRLLIIDEFLPGVEDKERARIMERLTDPSRPWTLIIVSNDPFVLRYCKEIVLMKEGKVAASGAFDEMKEQLLQQNTY